MNDNNVRSPQLSARRIFTPAEKAEASAKGLRQSSPSLFAHSLEPISNRESNRGASKLETPLSHSESSNPLSLIAKKRRSEQDRRPERPTGAEGFIFVLLPGMAPPSSVRLSAYRGVEAIPTPVLDSRFRRVIAFPPGGGAVTLIQTQRSNSQLEPARHEMPVRTSAFSPQSPRNSCRTQSISLFPFRFSNEVNREIL
jgi:hypothetical protein